VKGVPSTITVHFRFVFEENSVRKSHDRRDIIDFKKLRFENVFQTRTQSRPFQTVVTRSQVGHIMSITQQGLLRVFRKGCE